MFIVLRHLHLCCFFTFVANILLYLSWTDQLLLKVIWGLPVSRVPSSLHGCLCPSKSLTTSSRICSKHACWGHCAFRVSSLDPFLTACISGRSFYHWNIVRRVDCFMTISRNTHLCLNSQRNVQLEILPGLDIDLLHAFPGAVDSQIRFRKMAELPVSLSWHCP